MKFYPSFKLNVTWSDLFSAFSAFFLKHDNIHNNFLKDGIKTKYVIEVPSSRWGLFLLLKALNLQKGDEIIIPAYTYFAVPAAVLRAGCIPVFVDAEKDGINIDCSRIEAAVTKKTKAVIATHLCGFPCDIPEIIKITRKHNLILLEDCAQSFGAKYGDTFTGSYGQASYFSFSITKNMTMLRGGAVATDDPALAEKITADTLRLLPFKKTVTLKDLLKAFIMKIATSKPVVPLTCVLFYFFSAAGIDIAKKIFKEKNILLDSNFPLHGKFNAVQKLLALKQSEVFHKNSDSKEKNGNLFYSLLKNSENVTIPKISDNAKNIFSGMPVFVKNKMQTRQKLLLKGIDTSTGFVQCCPEIKEFAKYSTGFYPNARRAEKELLYFLTSDSVTDKDIKHIAGVLKKT